MKLHNELTHHNLKISLKNRIASNRLISLLLNIVLKAMTKNVKSYIFVATTGRSGTTSLSTIFEGCSGVKTFHEPYPVMYTPVDIESFHKTSLTSVSVHIFLRGWRSIQLWIVHKNMSRR